jgi:DNA primase
MLNDYPYIKRVFLCFDSDNAGKEAAKRIAEKLKQQHSECEILVPVGKDWNEDLTI